MTIFWTSDWHLGHARIIELSNRPFNDVDHMHSVLVGRANEIITSEDTLVLLGDTFMGNFDASVEVLAQVNTDNIVLYPGNHDKWADAYRNSAARRARFRDQLLERGWTVHEDRRPSVWQRTLFDGTEVDVSHYPFVGDSHGQDRFRELRPTDLGRPLVHGHVHDLWRVSANMVNVGCDVWDFCPVPEGVLASVIRDCMI